MHATIKMKIRRKGYSPFDKNYIPFTKDDIFPTNYMIGIGSIYHSIKEWVAFQLNTGNKKPRISKDGSYYALTVKDVWVNTSTCFDYYEFLPCNFYVYMEGRCDLEIKEIVIKTDNIEMMFHNGKTFYAGMEMLTVECNRPNGDNKYSLSNVTIDEARCRFGSYADFAVIEPTPFGFIGDNREGSIVFNIPVSIPEQSKLNLNVMDLTFTLRRIDKDGFSLKPDGRLKVQEIKFKDLRKENISFKNL